MVVPDFERHQEGIGCSPGAVTEASQASALFSGGLLAVQRDDEERFREVWPEVRARRDVRTGPEVLRQAGSWRRPCTRPSR